MKHLAGLWIAAAMAVSCVAGLSGCGSPQTYDEIHARNWTPESIEQRFPMGTTEKHVFEKLGSPFFELTQGNLTRWDFVGGKNAQQVVTFIFDNGKLVHKGFRPVAAVAPSKPDARVVSGADGARDAAFRLPGQ
jgi:outer membrane protein assembly factor BamE (lipoprotein component of BamABCDE complex)